jgi:hypothetical protein
VTGAPRARDPAVRPSRAPARFAAALAIADLAAAGLILVVATAAAGLWLGGARHGSWPQADSPASPAATQALVADATPTALAPAPAPTGLALAPPEPAPAPIGRAPAPPEPTLPAAVDWPQLPDLTGRTPRHTTAHFDVFPADGADAMLVAAADEWAPRLESILSAVSHRVHRDLPYPIVHVVFERGYEARCPARGLTSPVRANPLLMVYLTEETSELQIHAVLAHEMVHHLTARPEFVADGVLTEGIANWGGGESVLAWQSYPSWSSAVLGYLQHGDYVSLTEATSLNPRPNESCIDRRDRVYNTRAAFVDWLIDEVGLETVLAMPYLTVPDVDPATGLVRRDGETGEPAMKRVPDYRAATGYDLPTLEILWLADLWANR